MEIIADLVSRMVGCKKTKTHGFSILQTNAYNFKAFRKLQNNAFSPLVIAMHANNLRMFLLQALHFRYVLYLQK